MAGTALLDDNQKPVGSGYDPIGHQVVSRAVTYTATDVVTGIKYGYSTFESALQAYIRNGQIFTATTGAQAGNTQTSGVCLFNSSTAKSMLVFSIFVMNSNPGQGIYNSLRKVTTNPSYTNAITPVCTAISSANTSLLSSSWQASASITGIDIGTDNFNAGTNSKEMLQVGNTPGRAFLLGSGANTGLILYVGQSGTGGFWSVTFTYAEF